MTTAATRRMNLPPINSRHVGDKDMTPEVRHAMKSLMALGNQDLVHRICATVTQNTVRRQWATKHNVTPSSGHACIRRLLGKQCIPGMYSGEESR